MGIEGILKKTHAACATRPLENRCHQLSADTPSLCRRIDNDWSDCSDGVPLTEKVETENPAIGLSYYSKY
jgi:hypothetical protein